MTCYHVPVVNEAVAKAKAGHFQLACAAAWEGQHSCSCDTGINHPNQVCSRISSPQCLEALLHQLSTGAGHAWRVEAQGQEGCCRFIANATCTKERSSMGLAGSQQQ